MPRAEWTVPTDCKRFPKKISEEGLCRGRCERCSRLLHEQHAPRVARHGLASKECEPPSLSSELAEGDGVGLSECVSKAPLAASFVDGLQLLKEEDATFLMRELEDIVEGTLLEEVTERLQCTRHAMRTSDVPCSGL